jgi:hypothetical protein
VVCTHVSNVFGYILPVAALAALCRARRKPLILDAAQSAGTLDLASRRGRGVRRHAGTQGPARPAGDRRAAIAKKTMQTPLLYGGSGAMSVEQTMPDFLPERLEAGHAQRRRDRRALRRAGLSGRARRRGRGTARMSARCWSAWPPASPGLPSLRVLFLAGTPRCSAACSLVLPARMDCETLRRGARGQGVAVRSGHPLRAVRPPDGRHARHRDGALQRLAAQHGAGDRPRGRDCRNILENCEFFAFLYLPTREKK